VTKSISIRHTSTWVNVGIFWEALISKRLGIQVTRRNRVLAVFLAGVGGVMSVQAWDDRPTAPSPERAPHVLLQNDALRAWVALPSAVGAFYNGARFETAGAVAFLEADGVSFVGWGAPVNGGLTLGLSGEFIEPLPAGPDHLGVKIGVGVVQGADPKAHRLVRRFPWVVTLSEDAARFVQEGAEGPVAFRLTKSLTMEGRKLQISYRLENTGTVAWRTRHYGHNFLVPGGRAVQPGLVIEFPQDVSQSVVDSRLNLGARFDGRQVTFQWPEIKDDASVRLDLQGEELPTTVLIENQDVGARLRLTTSWKPPFYRLYCTWRDVCPEPFFPIVLEGGEVTEWSTAYQFEVVSPMDR
jgi:hypothetical protein